MGLARPPQGGAHGDHLDFEKGLLADLFPPETAVDETPAVPSRSPEDKLLADYPPIPPEPQEQVPNVTPADTVPLAESVDSVVDLLNKETTPDVIKDEQTYAVPLEVMQSITKNFSELQQHFEKVTGEHQEEERVLRIKSIHTVGKDLIPPPISPSGTVARLEIHTDKAKNTTTFTVLPPQAQIGDSNGHSVSVQTSDLSKAMKLLKPVHLERLPLLQRILFSSSKTPLKKSPRPPKPLGAQNPFKVGLDETELLEELKKVGVTYDRIHKLGGEWQCPEADCGKAFEKRSKLKLHIFSHKNVRPFSCQHPGCKWSFHSAFGLKRHQSTAHQVVKLYACHVKECRNKKVTFSTAHNLNIHLKRHARPMNFKCDSFGCDAEFQTNRELQTHLRNASHSDLIPQHACHDCDRRFFSPSELIKHTQIHLRVKDKLVCQFENCGKVFDKNSTLVAHSRSHTGERPFKCTFAGCSWAFRTSSKLRRHEKSHQNDRKFVCEICAKSYLRGDHLKAHTLSAHQNSKFACPMGDCSARFSARSTLYCHMKKHKEAAPTKLGSFRCVIESCGRKFESGVQLGNHVTVDHARELASNAVIDNGGQLANDEANNAAAELDFIAMLTSVGEEELVNDRADLVCVLPQEESNYLNELITVDASAIEQPEFKAKSLLKKPTQEKRSTKTRPSILRRSSVAKKRGTTQANSLPSAKKVIDPTYSESSTLNLQDLV